MDFGSLVLGLGFFELSALRAERLGLRISESR